VLPAAPLRLDFALVSLSAAFLSLLRDGAQQVKSRSRSSNAFGARALLGLYDNTCTTHISQAPHDLLRGAHRSLLPCNVGVRVASAQATQRLHSCAVGASKGTRSLLLCNVGVRVASAQATRRLHSRAVGASKGTRSLLLCNVGVRVASAQATQRLHSCAVGASKGTRSLLLCNVGVRVASAQAAQRLRPCAVGASKGNTLAAAL
jgi:hypothetical protein